MRVAINFDPSDATRVAAVGHLNLGEDAAVIDRGDELSKRNEVKKVNDVNEVIRAAEDLPPLRSLVVHLNSADSDVWTCGCRTWGAKQGEGSELFVFASSIDLIFSREENNLQSTHHESLAQRLMTLLGREKGEALRAELQVCPAEFGEGKQGYGVRVCLYAQGVTAEQAKVRWGLGMARLQQALLFTVRELRHELGA